LDVPPKDCALCPRLAGYRAECREKHPDWFNGAVPAFGGLDASLLIVGLAPGVSGANRTGRPFTGDWAGNLLYATLERFGFSNGRYGKHPGDGLELVGARITNAVRCVPPQNKPVGAEIANCRPFLLSEISALERLRVILCLGKISHDSTVRALGLRMAAHPFRHGGEHQIEVSGRNISLLSSYHCSRYNTNTRRLTPEMFADVFARARELASAP
jgi:uracil-DNA glycosylase